MLGILGIAEHLQKPLIAWNTADVLGRAGTRAVNAGRVPGSAFEEEQLFDFHGMMPVVAKIVEVRERRARAAEIAQPDLAFVEDLWIADGRSLRGLKGIKPNWQLLTRSMTWRVARPVPISRHGFHTAW